MLFFNFLLFFILFIQEFRKKKQFLQKVLKITSSILNDEDGNSIENNDNDCNKE